MPILRPRSQLLSAEGSRCCPAVSGTSLRRGARSPPLLVAKNRMASPGWCLPACQAPTHEAIPIFHFLIRSVSHPRPPGEDERLKAPKESPENAGATRTANRPAPAFAAVGSIDRPKAGSAAVRQACACPAGLPPLISLIFSADFNNLPLGGGGN